MHIQTNTFISDALLIQALKVGATDVHLSPSNDGYCVYYRITGVMTFVQRISIEESKKLSNHFKYVVGMDISERRHSQSKAFEYKWNETPIAMRISTLPTTPLESIAIRILNSASLQPLQTLSPFKKDKHHFNQLLNATPGLVLVTGSTGSGKTTTIYSIIKQLVEKQRYRIISVEDPIEHRIEGMTQVEIQTRGGLSFKHALRAILRHDPDIIVIGEIRDQATAAIAVQAANTGHVVIASLHVTNSFSTLERLRDLGIESSLSCIQAILYQKLVTQKEGGNRMAIFDWLLGKELKEAMDGVQLQAPFLTVTKKAWAIGMIDDETCMRLSQTR
ncbi:ATPase, T2SS/T4P/T4SS family [Shouchella hunanensis]|uniref:ATPase, T2SS/T4P/T4SS family n=1 Tax=Shouchella hunanensis TaxID=766894 RepID=A0ABY7W7C5_9BACI|nr:ATPase, T2SS/T4P/T4SS family [Shouchella hunanensis]WDF03991.1 ATPase, T2SS/T4P/T4SS family [Shouchella hunanensis]